MRTGSLTRSSNASEEKCVCQKLDVAFTHHERIGAQLCRIALSILVASVQTRISHTCERRSYSEAAGELITFVIGQGSLHLLPSMIDEQSRRHGLFANAERMIFSRDFPEDGRRRRRRTLLLLTWNRSSSECVSDRSTSRERRQVQHCARTCLIIAVPSERCSK